MGDNGTNSETSVRIRIRGRVQGVGFRKSAREKARRLGIEATAVNQPDGFVIVEASGPRDAVEAIIDWSRKGPALAEVDEIEVTRGPGTLREAMP
jgi:acylphosphatase